MKMYLRTKFQMKPAFAGKSGGAAPPDAKKKCPVIGCGKFI
jgi:hypothetical protein